MLSLLFVLVVIALVVGLIARIPALDPTIRSIIVVAGIIFALVYLGGALGVFNGWPQACRLR